MYDVLDISRYVINYSNDKGYGVSNLKLQKLLYFIQAYFLIEASKPCFKEKIEAWDFGPVVPEAYHEFKIFGCADIPSIKKYTVFNETNFQNMDYSNDVIDIEDKKKINTVIDQFKDYSASELVHITHNQRPWKEAYNQGKNTEIKQEYIRSYFV